MENNIQKFIRSNKNWYELLTKEPFCLFIEKDGGYTIFNYNQIDSDFSNPIVQESRGIILDSEHNVVCYPFHKFHNLGETLASKIDWASAVVQEKIDGSIIKVWCHKGVWRASTNGVINPTSAPSDLDPRSFAQLFLDAWHKYFPDFSNLDSEHTYMFELVSPYNRVVVPYNRLDIYHIGTRDNNTYEELVEFIDIPKPKIYDFSSLEDCVEMSKGLPFNQEGYVVVDKYFNRVKIKSPQYVAAHHLKNNGVVTYKRILDLIRSNQTDEFLSYFPEYQDYFDRVLVSMNDFFDRIRQDLKYIQSKTFVDRKEFASVATKRAFPTYLFKWLDTKVGIAEYFDKIPSEKMIEILKIKDEKSTNS